MEQGSSNSNFEDGNESSLVSAVGRTNAHDGSVDSFDSSTSEETSSHSFYELGKVYYDKSDLIMARENFVYSLECSEFPRDGFLMFKILGFLVRIASEQLDHDMATKYIVELENLLDKFKKTTSVLSADYFYNVGMMKNYRSLFDEAAENYKVALEQAKTDRDDGLAAKCLLALAVSYCNRNEYKTALEYLNALEEQLRVEPRDYLAGSMYYYFSEAYVGLKDFTRALEYFSLASSTLQCKKCWNLHGYILLGKGVVYKKLGYYEQSLTFLKLALESTDKTTFKRLSSLIDAELEDLNDSSVDLFLDRVNRKVCERSLGTINFKHRFVLLDILFLLAKNPGVYFDKERLAKDIWKDEYNPLIHDKLVYTSVSRLRKLIEPKAKEGEEQRKYIIRGKDGYAFNPQTKIRFQSPKDILSSRAIANVDISSPV